MKKSILMLFVVGAALTSCSDPIEDGATEFCKCFEYNVERGDKMMESMMSDDGTFEALVAEEEAEQRACTDEWKKTHEGMKDNIQFTVAVRKMDSEAYETAVDLGIIVE